MGSRFLRLTNEIGRTIVVRCGAITFIDPVGKADYQKGSGAPSDPDNPVRSFVELKRGGFHVRETVDEVLVKMAELDLPVR